MSISNVGILELLLYGTAIVGTAVLSCWGASRRFGALAAQPQPHLTSDSPSLMPAEPSQGTSSLLETSMLQEPVPEEPITHEEACAQAEMESRLACPLSWSEFSLFRAFEERRGLLLFSVPLPSDKQEPDAGSNIRQWMLLRRMVQSGLVNETDVVLENE